MRLPGITYRSTPGPVLRDVNAPLRVAAAWAGAAREVGDAIKKYQDREEAMEGREADLALSNDMTTFGSEMLDKEYFNTSDIPSDVHVNRDRPTVQSHSISAELERKHFRDRIEQHAKLITNPQKRAAWAARQTITSNKRYLTHKSSNLKKQKSRLDAKTSEMITIAIDKGDYPAARGLLAGSGFGEAALIKGNAIIGKAEEGKAVDDAIINNDLAGIEIALQSLTNKEYSGAFGSDERATEVVKLRAAKKKIVNHNKEDNRRAAAQGRTDTIWARRGAKSREQLLEEARRSPAAVRDSVVNRLKIRFNETDASENRVEKNAYESALTQIEKNPAATIQYSPDLPPGKRAALETYRSKLEAGTPILTKPEVYNELDELYLSQNPADRAKFQAMDLSDPKYLNGLSNEARSSFRAKQLTLGKPGSRPKVAAHATSFNGWVASLGIPSGKKRTPEQSRLVNELHLGLEQRLEDMAKQKKSDLTSSEVEAESARYFASKIYEPKWWQSAVELGFAAFGQEPKANWQARSSTVGSIGTIPKADLAEILEELRNAGLKISPFNIAKKYEAR